MSANIETLVDRMGSKYVLATLTSKRAREINRGVKVRLPDYDFSGKPHEIALREIELGLVNPVVPQPKPAPPVDPLA